MKSAFLFSGQGSQYAGMCHDLYQQEKIVQNVFEEASDTTNLDIEKLCFTENDQLNDTMYTQPALVTVSTAIARLLAAQGIKPDVVAGLSLGEYSAIIHSHSISFATGIKLIQARGKFMATLAKPGEMLVVLGLAREVVEDACQKASANGIVVPANYNMPGQIVIGGEVAAVEEAKKLLTIAGAKRILPMKVSGPFHTPLMEPAANALASYLSEVNFQPFEIPVISNTTATKLQVATVKDILKKQMVSPVYWEDSIRYMIEELGVDTFIEVGAKKTLISMVKKINKNVQMFHVENVETYQKLMTALPKSEVAK